MAEEMGVTIVKKWAIHASSKQGMNLKRKDLLEALAYCRQHKKVKYFLVDKVHRYMRDTEMIFYFKVRFWELGVKLTFCDPSQRDLNEDTPEAKLKLAQKGYDAEVSNVERSETALQRMSQRVQKGYYPFYPHAGYKKTEAENGLHIPDEPTFSLLRRGCHLIIYKNHIPEHAVKWMNENGYRTKGGKKLDTNSFVEFIADTYYCGVINIKKPGWPRNSLGLHVPLLSKREHDILVATIKKRNPRIRHVHNAEFMLGNLLRHKECQGLGGYEKFCGHFRNPGKRPSGKQRDLEPVYDCRDCRKRLNRGKVHGSFSSFLDSLQFVPDRKRFRDALTKVWRNQRGSVAHRLNTLMTNKLAIEKKIKNTTESFVVEQDEVIKNTLGILLKDYDSELKEVEFEIHQAKDVDLESEEFVKFAVDFVDTLREKWWQLSWENMKRGEQILFNGKIYMDNSAIVHPSHLSSIYRLGTNKKALSNVDNAHLVEHLEKSTPLIFEEIRRWRYLLWDDYIEYKHEQEQRKKLVVP